MSQTPEDRSAAFHHDPDEKPDNLEVLAVRITAFGGFDKIKVEKIELPLEIPAGHVEVKVHACGVNFADLYMRQGLMRNLQPPLTLGMECSGEVSALGPGANTLKVGDRVICYQLSGGLYQESVLVPQEACFLLPPQVPFEVGAALFVNYLTAYFSVLDIGNLQAGQTVLIHSCAGGVGWAATQLAHTVPEVKVYGTTSREEKHAAVKENGVNKVLDSQNYEEQLKQVEPKGVHLIVDSIGGANFLKSQRLLKPLGRAVLTGASSMLNNDRKLSFWDMLCVWWRTKSISPTEMINESKVVAGLHLANLLRDDPVRVRQALQTLFSMYEQKLISPKIDSVWPFEKVVEANKLLQERKNIGKVILKPLIK
ncbi:synaptic vesicle membrane protein VAT-1 homolog [Neocloeon triangulifer]|uniref:synaptic vesicle membrane protein VAT-1 homolog n=1 Tax=Neocloeon triangulifer TaxID=2078957 RepID=UPI00286F4BDC|nr:synaptic vesicle membrane protein VAT-1 homolog [Neocloeon triangulifer]